MNKIVKFWDKQAKNYDNSEARFEPAFVTILNKTKKYLKKADTLLDFGCASGSKTLQLHPFVGKISCIDISPKMIEETKKKAESRNIKNIDYFIGTIFHNDLSKETFDVIVSYGVLHLLKENDQVMKKIHELLKPGGIFISTTACLKEKMSLRSKIEFSMYMFIKKIGIFPLHLNMYRCDDVYNLVSKDFEIIESENMFLDIHMKFIVAKKKSEKKNG